MQPKVIMWHSWWIYVHLWGGLARHSNGIHTHADNTFRIDHTQHSLRRVKTISMTNLSRNPETRSLIQSRRWTITTPSRRLVEDKEDAIANEETTETDEESGSSPVPTMAPTEITKTIAPFFAPLLEDVLSDSPTTRTPTQTPSMASSPFPAIVTTEWHEIPLLKIILTLQSFVPSNDLRIALERFLLKRFTKAHDPVGRVELRSVRVPSQSQNTYEFTTSAFTNRLIEGYKSLLILDQTYHLQNQTDVEEFLSKDLHHSISIQEIQLGDSSTPIRTATTTVPRDPTQSNDPPESSKTQVSSAWIGLGVIIGVLFLAAVTGIFVWVRKTQVQTRQRNLQWVYSREKENRITRKLRVDVTPPDPQTESDGTPQ